MYYFVIQFYFSYQVEVLINLFVQNSRDSCNLGGRDSNNSSISSNNQYVQSFNVGGNLYQLGQMTISSPKTVDNTCINVNLKLLFTNLHYQIQLFNLHNTFAITIILAMKDTTERATIQHLTIH
ncbi:hypothetical protein ACTFIZ_001266 [Dictyostelium cf. discoideum]